MTAGPMSLGRTADVISSCGRVRPDRIDHLVLAKAAKVAQASALFDHPARAHATTRFLSEPTIICSLPMTATLRPASSLGGLPRRVGPPTMRTARRWPPFQAAGAAREPDPVILSTGGSPGRARS